jgi:hypothetical protein
MGLWISQRRGSNCGQSQEPHSAHVASGHPGGGQREGFDNDGSHASLVTVDEQEVWPHPPNH